MAKQLELATFRDNNRSINTEKVRITSEVIEAEYDLAFTLYSNLASQLDQAKIKLQDLKPAISVQGSIYVPYNKTKPRRKLIVLIITLLGLVIRLGLLIVHNYKEIVVEA